LRLKAVTGGRIGLLLLSLVLVVCFQVSKFPKAGALDWNDIYDVTCVLFLFPLIILCGAHSNAGTGIIRLCKFSGRLSYPLYITHIAFVYVLAGYAWARHPGTAVIIFWIFIVLPLAIAVARFFLKFFDEPVRAWLTRRYPTLGGSALSTSREGGRRRGYRLLLKIFTACSS
jgi:peptidoglycan/LPS O-acetylase OafA/YrhL